jgi:hypothetical protein
MSADPFQILLEQIKADYAKGNGTRSEQRIKAQFSERPGNLFLSHTSADADWCRGVLLPVIRRTCFNCFFLSLGALPNNPRIVDAFRVVVEYAFRYSKTVVIALSENSVQSSWARLEADWAIRQRHPIVICRIDDASPARLNSGLVPRKWLSLLYPPLVIVDFSRDEAMAQRQLDEVLQREQFLPAEVWRARGD